MKIVLNRKIITLTQRGILLFLLGAFVFCAEYNNPVDPKFPGDYNFTVLDTSKLSSMTLFNQYSIAICNTGSDLIYLYEYKLGGKQSTFKFEGWHQNKDTSFLKLYFKDTLTTTLTITGIRPNNKRIMKSFPVKVSCPYSINTSRDGSGINQENITVPLRGTAALTIDKNTKIFSELYDSITWFYDNDTVTLHRDSLLRIPNDAKKMYTVKADLKDTKGNIFSIYNSVYFTAIPPKIASISIHNFTDRKKIDSIPVGDSFYCAITVTDPDSDSDSDSDSVIVSVIDPSDTNAIKKDTSTSENDTTWFKMLPITDTLKRTLNIDLVDKYRLTKDSNYVVQYKWYKPSVSIGTNPLYIQANKDYSLSLQSSQRAVNFKWLIYNKKDTVIDTTTTSLRLIVNLKIDTFTIRVTPFDVFNYHGKTDTATLISQEYQYIISRKDSSGDTIATGVPFTLSMITKEDDSIINTILYKWTFSPDTFKNATDSFSISPDSSSVTFRFKDSVPNFKITVKGEVPSNSGAKINIFEQQLTIRTYTPVCTFITTSTDTEYVNRSFRLNYTVVNKDPSNNPECAKTFICILPDKTWRNYTSDSSVTFTTTGQKTIVIKAINTITNKESKPDTVTINVSSGNPYINLNPDSITAVINDPVVVNGVSAHPGSNLKSPIIKVFWDYTGDGVFDKETKASDTPTVTIPKFTHTGLDSIRIWCSDSNNQISAIRTLYVKIISDTPKIELVITDTNTHFINKPVIFTIRTKDPDDSTLTADIMQGTSVLKSYVIDTGSATLPCTLSQAGTYQLKIRVTDKDAHTTVYTLSDSIVIDPGIPKVDSINFADTGKKYINDMITFKIFAHDNDPIVQWVYAFNDTSTKIERTTNSIDTAFKNFGNCSLFVKVKDNDGNFSPWFSKTFTIYEGKPVVNTISRIRPQSEKVYINDTDTFSVAVFDTNGQVVSIDYTQTPQTVSSYSSKTFNTKDATIKIHYTYAKADTGDRTFYFRVHDDDGLISDWKSITVYVQKGIPHIDSINFNVKPDSFYIKDDIKFTIKVTDTNKNIDSIFIKWNTDQAFIGIKATTVSLYSFNKTFAVEDTGSRNITFRVKDSTGFPFDTTYNIRILLGAPIIDNIRTDSSTIWVVDPFKYRLRVRDPNGRINRIYVNWSGGITAQDSILLDTNSIDTYFTHSFDTTGGYRTVRFWAIDEDAIHSVYKDTLININRGKPIVSGNSNSGDTIWVVVNKGYSTYYYRPDHTDPNGTIITYYFGLNNNLQQADSKSRTDSSTIQVDESNINKVAGTRYIWAKDDDSLVSDPLRAIVFADSAPPKIETFPSPGDDSVTIYWRGKDVKDGNLTEYMILVRENTDPDSSRVEDILVNWKYEYRVSDNGLYDFMYRFKMTNNSPDKMYRYRVLARDKRRSVSQSDVANFPY